MGEKKPIPIKSEGCSFCSIAVDKGGGFLLPQEQIKEQIRNLPRNKDNNIVPFELINEYSAPHLPWILDFIEKEKLPVTEINLVLRADIILRSLTCLDRALQKAKKIGIRIRALTIGFESFNPLILEIYNKGISFAENIMTVQKLLELQEKFKGIFLVSYSEGARHGYIHKNPWESFMTFGRDAIPSGGIFPSQVFDNPITLMIDQGTPLANWIRQVEIEEAIIFPRDNTGSILWNFAFKPDGSIVTPYPQWGEPFSAKAIGRMQDRLLKGGIDPLEQIQRLKALQDSINNVSGHSFYSADPEAAESFYANQ